MPARRPVPAPMRAPSQVLRPLLWPIIPPAIAPISAPPTPSSLKYCALALGTRIPKAKTDKVNFFMAS